MIRFLGSLPFALFLIAIAALMVIAGTFIESSYGSHGQAERWIYKSFPFQLLLFAFFVNILISALLRYPFKKRHIPFLITHLGLLMVIAGVFIKMQFGVQGQITLVEGTASNRLTLPGTQVLSIEHRKKETEQIPIDKTLPKPYRKLALFPHAVESYSAWIHHNLLKIIGIEDQPLPVDRMITLEGIKLHLTANEAPAPLKILYGGVPFIHFQKTTDGVSIHSGDGKGLQSTETFDSKGPIAYALYDQGFQGCTALSVIRLGEKSIELESPLIRQVSITKPGDQLEENKPCFALQVEGEGETLLVWKAPFKTLMQSHERLYSFEEAKLTLPFTLRLHQARDIKYPSTLVTKSYECDLTLIEGVEAIKCTLSMNNVYETTSGYRLYLAGMGTIDGLGVRSAQIVINRDPAKHLLTYPGGILIACGIIGLFFLQKKK